MSMKLLTILQFAAVFSAYTLISVILPAFVFGRKLKEKKPMLSERFLVYFTVGNFYAMNLVFILQLLHISNWFTLTLGTLVPALYARMRFNHIPVKKRWKQLSRDMKRIVGGWLGLKTAIYRVGSALWSFGGYGRDLLGIRDADDHKVRIYGFGYPGASVLDQ